MTFLKLLSSVKDKDTATRAFWQWFLLSLIVEYNNLETDDENLIFYTENSIFSKLSSFLLKVIKGVTHKYKDEHFEIETNLNFNDLNIDEMTDIFNAGVKIEKLQKVIENNLNEKLYLFIDELETSKISATYYEDAILIKNLILIVERLNKLSENLFIIVAVRTEVLHNVFAAGAEINKLLESKGEEIQWMYERYNITHPLIIMIIKRIKYSMKNYNKTMCEKAVQLSDKEIFDFWFDNNLVNANGDTPQIILNNTWIKPRDIVRFMKAIQKASFLQKKINKVAYEKAIDTYSEKSWIEIREELVSILEEKDIKYIERVFTNYKKEFSFSAIRAEFRRKTNYNHDRIDEIIDILYEIGFIGNKYFENGSPKYRYSYRGDRYLDKSKNIGVHRGLWLFFSLKDVKKQSKDENQDDLTPNEKAYEMFQALK